LGYICIHFGSFTFWLFDRREAFVRSCNGKGSPLSQENITPNLSVQPSPILEEAVSSPSTENESCKHATLPKGSNVSNIWQPRKQADQSISAATQERSTPSENYSMFVEWSQELISWLCSALCLGASAIILRICKDRPVPQLHFDLTLNAIIALFSTLAKLALMNPVTECISQLKWTWFAKKERNLFDLQRFDLASRGEWGSFIFLVKWKRKSVYLRSQAYQMI